MALTQFPNGVTSFGVPVMGSSQIPSTSGQYIFVSSGAGANGNDGLSTLSPKATIAGALLQANASKGDVIVLMPGHAESIVGAAGLTISKAGVYIIGLGTGRLRPVITFSTSTAAQMIVSSAQTTFDNVVFDMTGIDAIVAAISVTAVDVAFQNCELITNNGTAGVVLGILTAATATRFRFENNFCHGPAVNSGTTTTAVIKHEVGIDYIIRNNYFTGKMTQAILNATTILGGWIDNNRFVIATGTVAITLAAASTAFIVNNRFNVPSGTAPVVAAAGFVAGNVYSAAAGVTAGTASTF